jgi:hypothetical protein
MVLVTGVPRASGWNNWKQHEPLLPQYPDRYAAAKTSAATAPTKPAPVDPDTLEWKAVRTVVTPPSERDTGMIIEAKYAIAGSELRLNFQGKVYAEAIGANDDPVVVASRLLRSKWGRHEEFYGPINYPPHSIH